jgi:nucleoside-diphosphate-sugar epimerase
MKSLVVGATGATGRLLVDWLLEAGQEVRVVVRSAEKLSKSAKENPRLSVTQASLLDLSDGELDDLVAGCEAVASCLGHTLTFKGIYGSPRRLVTDATRRLCEAVQRSQPDQPVRYVLMNTAGNANRDLNEPATLPHRGVIGLLRLLLPPHVDNEAAADFLRQTIGHDHPAIRWVAVRPDALINEEQVTPYDLHSSPTRDAIFNSGKTSRINVADFMGRLMTTDALFNHWSGQMPVMYNRDA